nr:hypothetical protein CFP56_31336 [Quercus suber]
MVDVNLMGISKMIKAAFITMKNWRDCGSCPSMLVKLVYTFAWLIQCVSLDFVLKGLHPRRTNKFDSNAFQILTIKNVASVFTPPGFWLNIQVMKKS